MSYSISTLLPRNLHDVFGENDPVRRRAWSVVTGEQATRCWPLE